jgi:hypothetical protein
MLSGKGHVRRVEATALEAPLNMGLLAKHASTVPLVLNLDSGYINSQFNIVFDDWFVTVAASMESLPDLSSPEWSRMFGDSTFQFSFDGEDDNREPMVEANSRSQCRSACRSCTVSQCSEQRHGQASIPLPTVRAIATNGVLACSC